MLRAFGAEAVLEDRGIRDRLAGLASGAAQAGTMALLCGAAGGAPGFAMAFFVAALLSGGALAALLLGGLLGGLWQGLAGRGTAALWGVALALAGSVVWSAAEQLKAGRAGRFLDALRQGLRVQARSPTRETQRRAAILAGGAALAPGLVLAGGEAIPSLLAVASALSAVCAAPFMLCALSVRPGRRALTREERAGLLILAAMAASGLGAVSLPAAGALCAALAVLLYPAGAACGLCLGLALLLAGDDGRLAAMLGAGGLAAQLCGGGGPWLRGGAACGAMMALTPLLRLPVAYLACPAAALAPSLLPAAWQRTLALWARPPRGAWDPDRVAALARGGAVRRLSALSDAFAALAEGYLGPMETPDEQALLAGLRERLCDGCSRYAQCWRGERSGGAGLLCEWIARAVEWSAGDMSRPLFPEEATPELLRRCRRGRLAAERLGEPLEDFARARQAELKRGAENRLISAQFLEAQRLLEGMAEDMRRPLRLRDRAAERATAALEAAGLPVGDVLALAGPRPELAVSLREGCWDRPMAEAAAGCLRRTFGGSYRPEGPWGRELRFVRRPRLRAGAGAVSAPRREGAPSGDSHLVMALEGDRLLVLLCDGMGSGDGAARESAAAVRLLARFMAAGADSAHAVETVNALLLNRSREDMFATVDMLVLDLGGGEASFTKLAACPTLLLSGGELRRVRGGRLPLGILERVQPARARTVLAPGDALVMVTDGVWEALGPEALAELLLAGGADMDALAGRVLGAAEAAVPPDLRDDMTVVCVKLEAAC